MQELPAGVQALSSGLPPSALGESVIAMPHRRPGPDDIYVVHAQPVAAPMVDPLAYAAESIAKAAVMQNSRKPPYVAHKVGEATRLFSNLNGIKEDLTLHQDDSVKRALASKNPALRAVLNLILSDVVAHFSKPIHEKAIGIKIQQKDRKRQVTQATAKRQEYIEQVLLKGGLTRPREIDGQPGTWDSHEEETGDSLQIAVRKLLGDSLTLDAMFIVIEGSEGRLNGGGHPVTHWRAEDAALIRMVDTRRYQPRIRDGYNGTDDLARQVKWVQLSPMNTWDVVREYRWNEGALGIRNPRTDTLSMGYGESEIEQCLMCLIGVLFTLTANQDYFSRNHIPQGLLALKGNFSREDLQALRTQLHQEVGYGSGGGLFDFPIIATDPTKSGDGAAWVPFQDKAAFEGIGRLYLELCVALISAVFSVAPEEYGFSAFGGAQNKLGDADPESVIANGKYRRLQLVLWLCDFFNQSLISKIDDDFELVIQGLNNLYTKEAAERVDLELKEMQKGYTPNMLRARDDEPPIVDPKDWVLWRQVEAKLQNQWFANDTVRMFAIIEEYERQGGERCLWPDLPIGNPQAFTLAQQEHGLVQQQQTQDQMGKMANAEADNQRTGQDAEAQGARDQMGNLVGAADERQAQTDAEDAKASANDDLRVPGLNDPAMHKAIAPGRVVIRIGPRE